MTPPEQPVPSAVSDSTEGRRSCLPQQTKIAPGVAGTGLSPPCPVTSLVAPFWSLDCALEHQGAAEPASAAVLPFARGWWPSPGPLYLYIS